MDGAGACAGSHEVDGEIEPAVEALRSGGVIAYPTEGVFGLGCDPRNEAALARILVIKRRSPAKGFIIVGACADQLMPYLAGDAKALRVALDQPSDRPTTWIMPAASGLSEVLTGGQGTVAVRVTTHPGAASLCRDFAGAVVSTSANLSGEPALRDPDEVRERFSRLVDVVVHQECGRDPRPSRIVDWRSGRVVRE